MNKSRIWLFCNCGMSVRWLVEWLPDVVLYSQTFPQLKAISRNHLECSERPDNETYITQCSLLKLCVYHTRNDDHTLSEMQQFIHIIEIWNIYRREITLKDTCMLSVKLGSSSSFVIKVYDFWLQKSSRI